MRLEKPLGRVVLRQRGARVALDDIKRLESSGHGRAYIWYTHVCIYVYRYLDIYVYVCMYVSVGGAPVWR